MFDRCYSHKQKAYLGKTVCDEWHNFQNFAKWYEENYNPETMEGWQLDKDILVKGNKIYSPDTCTFVPQEINILFINTYSYRGDLPLGVVNHRGKFRSAFSKNKERISLGVFNTPQEAFQAYKTAKEEYIKEVADKWKGMISEKVYQAMYNYKVEITY